ncbi:delphilin isoform X2 [Stigmatopora argus]
MGRERSLARHFRIFIPKKHRERFDEALSRSLAGGPRGRSFGRGEDRPGHLPASARATSVPRAHAEEGGSSRGMRKTASLTAGRSGACATNRRTVRVRKGNMSFGFTLRGHAPVWIDSVIPGSAADEAGLRPGDRIMFLNGLDMRTSSHEKVVSMLQGSGAAPTLVVEDGPPSWDAWEREATGSGVPAGGARSPTLGSLRWVAEILPPSIRVQGRTFGQQLEHLLTVHERYAVCKALENFFQRRNVDVLIVDVFPLLDTPAKQAIWQFVYQLLTYEEQECCRDKIARFLGLRAPVAAAGPEEPHRRSSSVRVTGSAYGSGVRGRSSDDLLVGTRSGFHADSFWEAGTRLTPGERQSGDGTSLPETPNNLTNLSAVYAELENVYAARRSKSLKTRPPPAPETFLDTDTEAASRAATPTAPEPAPAHTGGGSRSPAPTLTWPEPPASPPPCPSRRNSVESNPYVSLDSPPQLTDLPSSPPARRDARRRYTFSEPPRSQDTDRFLDALSEQLGRRVAIVDDFLTPENDYEEDASETAFPDEEEEEEEEEENEDEDEDESGADEEESGGLAAPEPSSPSEVQSSSGEESASSLTYSSSSDHIPPPPVSPPPPPPVQFDDPPAPPPAPAPSQGRERPGLGPERPARAYVPVRRKSGPPPPPPPRADPPPKRHSFHKVVPAMEEARVQAAAREPRAYGEQGSRRGGRSHEGREAYEELQATEGRRAFLEQRSQREQMLEDRRAYEEQMLEERRAYEEQNVFRELRALEEQMLREQQVLRERQERAFREQLMQQIYQGQGHGSMPAQVTEGAARSPLGQPHRSLPPLPAATSEFPDRSRRSLCGGAQARPSRSAPPAHHPPPVPGEEPRSEPGRQSPGAGPRPLRPSAEAFRGPGAHYSSSEIFPRIQRGETRCSSTELLHQAHQMPRRQPHHSSAELLREARPPPRGPQPSSGEPVRRSSAELLGRSRQPPRRAQPRHHSSSETLHREASSPQERRGPKSQRQTRASWQGGRPAEPSPQRPRSVQRVLSPLGGAPAVHHIQHVVSPPPPPQDQQQQQQQIHTIHSPQQAHRSQPLLSTFRPLRPPSDFWPLPRLGPPPPQRQQAQPAPQSGRPHSQPSQHLMRSQHKAAPSESQPQSLPHSLSDPAEQAAVAAPAAPPPPPPRSPAPVARPTLSRMESHHMSVKRLRWEQLEDSEGTIWGQLGVASEHEKLHDMVKYLDLEMHFGTRKASPPLPEPPKEDAIEILSREKARGVSFLLARTNLSHGELRQALMCTGARKLQPSHAKQLLLCAPDAEELRRYRRYAEDPGQLGQPDLFVLQMLSVPEYETRLESLLFKDSLQEKTEELRGAYRRISEASSELRGSKKLAKILEFVLAMGNYLSDSRPRGDRTTGFKINFLTELSTTKTLDGKSTFLHILVQSLRHHFPDVLDFAKDLSTVPLAAKVNQRSLASDVKELQGSIQNIRAACHKMPATAEDRFAIVMSTFLENSHPSMQSLESLQQSSLEEFSATASYFGEDGPSARTEAFFGIFAQFIHTFQSVLGEQLAAENPAGPGSASPPPPR